MRVISARSFGSLNLNQSCRTLIHSHNTLSPSTSLVHDGSFQVILDFDWLDHLNSFLAPRLCTCKQARLDLVSAWKDLDPVCLCQGCTIAILTWLLASLRITPEPPKRKIEKINGSASPLRFIRLEEGNAVLSAVVVVLVLALALVIVVCVVVLVVHALTYYIIIGSAEALPILCVRYFRWERERERQRERERERRKWRHHCRAKIGDECTLPLPKIHTIGDELTLSIAKNSHFSFLPSHFPSLPSRKGHHCGAEIRNEFPLSIGKLKFFRPICSPSFKWHEPRDEWSKTQDKWSNPGQSNFVLPNEKMNQINTKNYWK